MRSRSVCYLGGEWTSPQLVLRSEFDLSGPGLALPNERGPAKCWSQLPAAIHYLFNKSWNR
jgi:hypothetical protein